MFVTMGGADLHVIFSGRLPVAILSFATVALLFAVIARFLLKKDAGTVTVGAAASGYINVNNMGLPSAQNMYNYAVRYNVATTLSRDIAPAQYPGRHARDSGDFTPLALTVCRCPAYWSCPSKPSSSSAMSSREASSSCQ